MTDVLDKLRTTLAGHYRLEREVGAGGMATVYLAHDLKHDRRVALKVLRPELAAAVGSERFLREIKLTAGLQHPHILPLYDSGDADGTVYYVMPFVEGESLRTRLDRVRQLPVREALDIARAVASALDYAHRRNIVHRDIKPENILLGVDEQNGVVGLQALVGDFGVAVAMEAAGISRLTGSGISVGTPAYMSPEQASAERTLGASSDVYSLGVVLYEMLTGEPPFTGPTAQAVVSKVMSETPVPLRLRRSTVPHAVEDAVTKALAKVPADRFATAARFAEALHVDEHPAAASPDQRPFLRSAVVPWILAAALAAGLIIQSTRRPPEEGEPMVAHLLPPPGEEFSDRRDFGALSPDGRRLAFVVQPTRGLPRLWVRDLRELRAEPLAGTEGASAPFWAPDGRSIAFFANGQLLRVNSTGGTPVRITNVPVISGESATWGADDAMYFSTEEGIHRIDVGEKGAGPPRLVFRSDSANRLSRPSIGDDTNFLVLTSADVMLVGDVRTGAVTRVKDGAYDSQLAGESTVAYVGLGDALYLQRIDLAAAKVVGEPIQIGGPVRSAQNLMSFTTSATGTVAYLLARPIPGPLVVDRAGVVLDTIRQEQSNVSVGHKPSSLALGGNAGLFRYDLARRTPTLLHSSAPIGILAVEWSPDDTRLAFSEWCTLRIIEPSGAGLRSLPDLPEGGCLRVTDWWSKDTVLVTRTAPRQSSEIWEYRISEGTGSAIVGLGPDAADGTVSPDGKNLAYSSGVGGARDVFVRPLRQAGAGERISVEGGRAPRWRGNGRELFFVTAAGDVMAADVVPGTVASIGQPRRLFRASEWERSFFTSLGFRPFDVSRDGQRFYLMQSRIEGPAVLVLNSHSLLR